NGTTLPPDSVTFTVRSTATAQSEQSLSWTAPPEGSDQLVVIDGRTAPSVHRDGRVLVDSLVANGATVDYDVFYSTRAAQSNTLDVTSTAVTTTVPDPDPTKPPQVIITGYDLGVTANLDATEAANIGGGLRLAPRPDGRGIAITTKEC